MEGQPVEVGRSVNTQIEQLVFRSVTTVSERDDINTSDDNIDTSDDDIDASDDNIKVSELRRIRERNGKKPGSSKWATTYQWMESLVWEYLVFRSDISV